MHNSVNFGYKDHGVFQRQSLRVQRMGSCSVRSVGEMAVKCMKVLLLLVLNPHRAKKYVSLKAIIMVHPYSLHGAVLPHTFAHAFNSTPLTGADI